MSEDSLDALRRFADERPQVPGAWRPVESSGPPTEPTP